MLWRVLASRTSEHKAIIDDNIKL